MKYLLSGSNGFIGSALKQALLNQGHQVLGLSRDLLFTPVKLRKYIEEIQPDYIIHLATYGNMYTQADDLQTVQSNIIGTFNLLRASNKLPYKGFINVSSSSTLLPYETFYSATKSACEKLVRAFVNKYGKPIATVRPYSVYGAGDNPNHFIPTALRAFKEDKELSLSHGYHDWIYIDDLVSGILTVIKNIEALKGKEVNIGTGQSYSNSAVISYLREIFGKPGNVLHVDSLRPYDSENWVADVSVLRKLGWEPETDLNDGLERLVYGNKK